MAHPALVSVLELLHLKLLDEQQVETRLFPHIPPTHLDVLERLVYLLVEGDSCIRLFLTQFDQLVRQGLYFVFYFTIWRKLNFLLIDIVVKWIREIFKLEAKYFELSQHCKLKPIFEFG